MPRCIVLIVCVALSASSVLGQQRLQPVRQMKPALVWTGTDSKIDKEAFVRCTSQPECDELWQKHRGVNPWGTVVQQQKDDSQELDHCQYCPQVDFDSHMIVAVFSGRGAHEGMSVKSVLDERDFVRIGYKVETSQPGPARPNAPRTPARKPAQGYVFAVLPRSEKPIILEQDVRREINAPPVWIERARLATPK